MKQTIGSHSVLSSNFKRCLPLKIFLNQLGPKLPSKQITENSYGGILKFTWQPGGQSDMV